MEQMDFIKGPQEQIGSDMSGSNNFPLMVTKPTSLATLIDWNISKAVELNPSLDLKDEINSAQCRIEQLSDAQEFQAILSKHPYQRHVACALLAWQQLGHNDVESLYRFIESKRAENECSCKSDKTAPQELQTKASKKSNFAKPFGSSTYYSDAMGPVVKLPVESKVVMRLGHSPCGRQPIKPMKKPKAPEKDIMNKIAHCLDLECSEQLKEMDTATKELRTRAAMLARREAERVELLERAETAWGDLELGYQRRVRLTEEKEQDLINQVPAVDYYGQSSNSIDGTQSYNKNIEKVLKDRNRYKNASTALTEVLKKKSDEAQKDRTRFNLLETEVCHRACHRMKLSDEASKADALASEETCRANQLDRDLQFKEEQTRRSMLTLQNEVESVRALTFEAERALRGELSSLRDQIDNVSKEMMEEDLKKEDIKKEVEAVRQEKMELIEDLEGCKVMCDGRMQEKVDVLNTKKVELAALKEKFLECQCRLPIDATVEAKRTPSLAALCKCTPEDKIMESCSCTSMRTRLLSNLLADLFSGLQTELASSVNQMPCQLLKCLEDKHNWDRTTVVKTNLRSYFSKLLVGELDIAIATSIENYHAKWVGLSCADVDHEMTPEPGEETEEGWEARAIERRAQKLAAQLAEQLFQERADELTQQAKDIVSSGPPPCECMPRTDPGNVTGNESAKVTSGRGKAKGSLSQTVAEQMFTKKTTHLTPVPAPKQVTQRAKGIPLCECKPPKATHEEAVYSCLVTNPKASDSSSPVYWRQAMQGVTQLRMQVEDLKKDSIKKEDLKTMEDKFTKIIQRSSHKSPSRSDEIEQKPGRKNLYRSSPLGREGKMNEAAAVFPCLVKNKPATIPVYWHQAMQDVTQIRKQIENLKKDSLKKEDLKTMEDKFAKMIQRNSGGTATTINKIDLVEGNDANVIIKKEHKSNRATDPTGLHSPDVNKSVTAKGLQMKKGNKPGQVFNRRIAKPFKLNKKNEKIYAVNMCLCSNTKQQQKESNDKCKAETTAWKQKCSKETVSLMSSSIRQSKPINTSLLSQNNNARTKCKESEDQSCPSNCVCFHKMPSNSSIDKLLETLAKWKFDLDASCYDKCKNSSCVFISKSDVGNIPDIKQVFKDENVSLKSKTSFNPKDKPLVQPTIKSHDCLDDPNSEGNNLNLEKSNIQLNGPMGTTESEYMGAINLEKSNEELCQCVKGAKNKTTPFKCITSNKCSCERIIEDRKRGGRKLSPKREKCLKITVDLETQKKQKNNVTVLENMSEKEKENKVETREEKKENTLNDTKTNAKAFDPCNKDYKIKFLGVTLADADLFAADKSSHNNDDNAYKTKIKAVNYTMRCEDSQPSQVKATKGFDQNYTYRINNSNKDCEKDNISEFQKNPNLSKKDSNDICKDHNNQEEYSNYRKMQSPITRDRKRKGHKVVKQGGMLEEIVDYSRISTEDQRPIVSDKHALSCHCSVKFDEFKKFINDKFDKQMVNEDVALDVQSFKDLNSKDDSCVCCNKLSREETKDLEQNAFHLLEEYLKKKLVEFKGSSSNPSSISSEEEEKIFTIILQKVKQLISDSTNQIACKCLDEEENSQGSWSRAYGMLKEYIKMKINKVQCSCVLEEDNNEILPGLLDKVCKLIDYDFQRLKDASGKKIDSKTEDNAKKYLKQVNFESEVPEKDTNIVFVSSNANANNAVPLHFLTLDDKIICDATQTIYVKQSISSQVPLNLEMEFESCDPLETNNKNVVPVNAGCHLSDKYRDCKCDPFIDFQLLDTRYNKPSFIEDDYNMNTKTYEWNQLISGLDEKDSTVTCLKEQDTFHFHVTHNDDNAMSCAYEDASISSDCNKAVKVSTDKLKMKKDIPAKSSVIENNVQNVSFTNCSNLTENSNNYHIDNMKSTKIKSEEYIDQRSKRKQKSDAKLIQSDKELVTYASDCDKHYDMNIKTNSINECCETNAQQNIIVSNNNSTTQNSENPSLNQLKNITKYPDVPYVGYTIDCSCNNSLGACVCSRSIIRTDTEIISNIWRKAIPDETYFKKVSYIMRDQPKENFSHNTDLLDKSVDCAVVLRSILKKNATKNNYQAALGNETGPMMLKQSMDNVDKTHAMTNTLCDNISVETDNSANEDWCECNMNYHSNYNLDSEFKNSIYFPAPLVDFDNLKYKCNSDETPVCLLPKQVCNCDMVPICYVKMLVENIETKLTSAKCTCDLLSTKLCPVHYKKC